jgi:DNA-binding response OmpR family regulator
VLFDEVLQDTYFMNRIAILEDNERLAELVKRALANAGVESDTFIRIEPAWHALQETSYAAVVVDRGLPDGDGLSLVRRLREAGRIVPCLMLTARDALHDRVEGLESGADDYLVKPFSMEELVARVRALMRRPASFQSLSPAFGDISVSSEDSSVTRGFNSVTLAPAELQILVGLVRAGGKTVRRTTLEVAAWGYSEAVTPNALDVALHRLRKKLQAVGSSLQVVNVRGLGYALSED